MRLLPLTQAKAVAWAVHPFSDAVVDAMLSLSSFRIGFVQREQVHDARCMRNEEYPR